MQIRPVDHGSVKRILFRAVALPLILMAVLAGVLLWQISELLEVTRLVQRSDRVTSAANRTMRRVLELETGLRGYLLTGEREFLEPYLRAQEEIAPIYESLQTMLANRPQQLEQLEQFEGLYTEWQEYAEEALALRDGGGDYLALVRTGRGKRLVDAIRAELGGLVNAEEAIQEQRSRAAQAAGTRTLVFGGGLTLLLGALLAIVTRGQILRVSRTYDQVLAEQQRAEGELKALNAALEARVLERTAELQSEVTERQRAEEAATVYAKRLEQSNRELQDFAVVASHDLQEPLRKIQAFGDLLEDEYREKLAGDGHEYLEEMRGAAGRMQRLIQALLTLSRVTTRGQPFVPTELETVVREVLEDLQARLEETGGRVEVGDLPVIDADPMQMRQLFQNLIGNGLKFHRPGVPPVVTVRGEVEADESGARAVITVEDNGIGFDEKYLDRIFAPFQRLHGRSGYEGTGMGLTICRRIVERHSGRITASSTPGEGSRFQIVLPVEQPKGEAADAERG